MLFKVDQKLKIDTLTIHIKAVIHVKLNFISINMQLKFVYIFSK